MYGLVAATPDRDCTLLLINIMIPAAGWEAAMNLAVDARDPLGKLVGSLVVVGPNVTDLENELRSALQSPGDLHDNAPEIRVPSRFERPPLVALSFRRLRDSVSERRSNQPERPCRCSMRFSRPATTSFRPCTTASNGRRREIHVDEIRRSLAHLDPDRLLATTDVNLSMQKALSVLLGADRPLSGLRLLAERRSRN